MRVEVDVYVKGKQNQELGSRIENRGQRAEGEAVGCE